MAVLQISMAFLISLHLLCFPTAFSDPLLHDADHHHGCSHGHHHHSPPPPHENGVHRTSPKLPQELVEEEDLRLHGFSNYHHHHHDHDHTHIHDHESALTGLGLWLHALGCSLLVSFASLICLIVLPIIFIQGKPSKAVVDSLALFGAGAMLGDAFLHQLPHAFGGEHSHSRDHDHSHIEHGHSHAHSLKDLSVGLSVLAGIVLFLLVEKVVRYVEANSFGAHSWGHSHHHHHHNNNKKLKDEDETSDDSLNAEISSEQDSNLRKRKTTTDDKKETSSDAKKISIKKETFQAPSNLVFGYLNLFSDGVHNFTDGMALGSAFMLYGSVGGWSRTLFLLAHELPQEIGDFGILIRSGFSAPKALFFNFLSALLALAGTALALLWGQDPGQSSLIEGFTAGGFIYIAVAGVLAEMNNGISTFKSSVAHIVSLTLGMAVALCISLVE